MHNSTYQISINSNHLNTFLWFSLILIIVQPLWSSAARKDLVKLQLAQNRAAHFALPCNQRADINTMHSSLCIPHYAFHINVLKIPNCLHSQLTHSSDTHLSRQTCHQGSFHCPQIQNKFKKAYNILWNCLPSHFAQTNSKPGLKKTDKATTHGTTPLRYLT